MTWVNLEHMTQSETTQTKSSHVLIHLYEISKIGTSIETERLVITGCSWGWGLKSDC